jgi:hypothetical protein
MSHSRTRSRGFVPQYPWDLPDDGGLSASSDMHGLDESFEAMEWEDIDGSDDEDDQSAKPRAAPTRSQAEAALGDYLIGRVLQGKMPCVEACVISYWASLAGVGGVVADLAMSPDSPSGHFSRRFDDVVGIKKMQHAMTTIDVPGHSRSEMGRIVHKMPVIAPHEALHHEFVQHPELEAKLVEQVADGDLPAVYMNNAVAVASSHTVQPVVLYADGFPISKKEGLIGFWVYFYLSQTRHLVAVIRKSRLCRCGCRGWCSIYPVLSFLRWSLHALSQKRYPSEDMSGKQWGEDDAGRESLAGEELAVGGVCFEIKGDWLEMQTTFGFANWADLNYPCFVCDATPQTMYRMAGMSAVAMPWKDTNDDDYHASCRACELFIEPSVADIAAMTPLLFYDRRSKGSRGRALRRNYPPLGLRAGDRLEPSFAMPDIAKFEQLPPYTRITIWRKSEETRTRHRNPLIDIVLGISVRTFVVDLLHAFHLGVMKTFAKELIWELALSNIYSLESVAKAHLEQFCSLLKADLNRFYAIRRAAGETYSELQEFRLTMIGGPDSRTLRLKAAETKGFFFFLTDILRRRGAPVRRQDVWLGAASALESLMLCMSGGPMVVSPSMRQETRT